MPDFDLSSPTSDFSFCFKFLSFTPSGSESAGPEWRDTDHIPIRRLTDIGTRQRSYRG